MSRFDPVDPQFETRVRSSFDLQRVMKTIGATLVQVLPGEVHIRLPYQLELTQQDGFVHAGIITTIVDSACGYAAYTLMPAASRVLTVEYKVNLLSPATGDYFVAVGNVKKPGRTLSICAGDVYAHKNDEEKLVATMLATMMRL